MSDWPLQSDLSLNRGIISNADPTTPLSQHLRIVSAGFSSSVATWQAQRACFCPVIVQKPATITHLIASVTNAAGNWNMGIYEEDGSSVVLGTKAAVPAVGIGSFNITDTTLETGLYYIALWCDSSTARFHSNGTISGQIARTVGIKEQLNLATDLPATATFSTTVIYGTTPYLAATLKTTF